MKKKEYKSQFWQHNMQYTYIFIITNVIILEKAKKNEKLSKNYADTIGLTKMAQTLSYINPA